LKRYAMVLVIGLLVLGPYAFSQLARVPSAAGRYGEGHRRLIDAGFRVDALDGVGRPVEHPHDLALVVSQEPAAGAIRPFRSTVTLRIESPSAMVTVPDVVGMRVSDAFDTVHDAGLMLDTGGFIADDGTVTATWPAAGRAVPFGLTVGYSVADH
jgi:beta-lactam-binding protein with PASTA domain